MPGPEIIPHDSHQPPSNRGHPLPRRALPANSVTLRHHRLAIDASLRASAGSGPVTTKTTSLARRYSSGESHDTGNSDAKKWFDQSNQNPTATFDSNAMDVDPPFFQKESDSSNEDKPFQFKRRRLAPLQRNAAYTSTADDYRSVIDDLTVEIQKLKEELKRHKQDGPDLLQKVKLFEIKIHGLPKETVRGLETTLRDFVAGLDTSPDESASREPRMESKHATRDHMYSGSRYKHASSPLGPNQRPFDSAYASMSTNATSSVPSLGKPSMNSDANSSDLKTENYLCDMPEGLYHRPIIMTDGYKKNLVVRRLEQLFTGKTTGRGIRRVLPVSPPTNKTNTSTPVTLDGLGHHNSTVHQPPGLLKEPAREAQILPPNQQPGSEHKKPLWKSRGYALSWNGEQTEGNSSSGTSTSPPHPALPEQRPTRPNDLDPDRVQVPSENMDYIKHLGLVPPELMGEATSAIQHGDYHADDWVYLNLLCNLAQLHIINVTPNFVRSAVSEISTKFQLSPDGRKIRWRGGSGGTQFASESSGTNSHRSVEPGDTDVPTAAANESHRQRQSTGPSTGAESQSGADSSKNLSKFGPQISASSDRFHYKPLSVRQHSFTGPRSPEETLALLSPFEDSDVGGLGRGHCGSGTSNRRKRRRDGAIIYYSGAPFFIDLSGDHDNASPSTYISPSGQPWQKTVNVTRPGPIRSTSDPLLVDRPSSAKARTFANAGKMYIDGDPDLATDTDDDVSELDVDFDTPWTTEQQYGEVRPLEPCGLGGVVPDDHFMVVVTTARSKSEILETSRSQFQRLNTDQTSGGIMNRLASTSTSLPASRTTVGSSLDKQRPIGITYTSGRIKRLAPVPLPPPAILFQSFSTGSSSSDEDNMSEDICDKTSSEELMNWCANHHRSVDYPGTRTKLVSVRDE